MERDTHFTKVIFRMFKGEVIALFPAEAGDMNANTCNSYQHVGQHGAATVNIMNRSTAATYSQYKHLYEELKSIGYKLQIVYKFTSDDRKSREAQLRRA